MAKRKLSESQRSAIRQELSKLLRTAKTKADALRSVAKKYGITTITARWYAKTLSAVPKPAARPAAAKPPVKRRSGLKAASVKASASRNGHAGGAVQKLVAGVQAAAEKAFTRARLARQLIPRWQNYVKKELSLRQAERKVRQELQAVAKKARALHEKIKGLTS